MQRRNWTWRSNSEPTIVSVRPARASPFEYGKPEHLFTLSQQGDAIGRKTQQQLTRAKPKIRDKRSNPKARNTITRRYRPASLM